MAQNRNDPQRDKQPGGGVSREGEQQQQTGNPRNPPGSSGENRSQREDENPDRQQGGNQSGSRQPGSSPQDQERGQRR